MKRLSTVLKEVSGECGNKLQSWLCQNYYNSSPDDWIVSLHLPSYSISILQHFCLNVDSSTSASNFLWDQQGLPRYLRTVLHSQWLEWHMQLSYPGMVGLWWICAPYCEEWWLGRVWGRIICLWIITCILRHCLCCFILGIVPWHYNQWVSAWARLSWYIWGIVWGNQ